MMDCWSASFGPASCPPLSAATPPPSVSGDGASRFGSAGRLAVGVVGGLFERRLLRGRPCRPRRRGTGASRCRLRPGWTGSVRPCPRRPSASGCPGVRRRSLGVDARAQCRRDGLGKRLGEGGGEAATVPDVGEQLERSLLLRVLVDVDVELPVARVDALGDAVEDVRAGLLLGEGVRLAVGDLRATRRWSRRWRPGRTRSRGTLRCRRRPPRSVRRFRPRPCRRTRRCPRAW